MKHVLIAGDDTSIHSLAIQVFQGRYHVTSLPVDMELTLDLIQDQIDVVLYTVTDANSDCSRVYQIIEEQSKRKRIPFIFLVGESSKELEHQALNRGVGDIISIPVTPELLIHRVNACLELYSLQNDRSYVEKYLDAVSISFAELVECRDMMTGGHLKNTTNYFKILLEEALQRDYYKEVILMEDRKDLLRSAALHDIGKIGITDDILRKASSLNDNEYEYMKQHTTLGKLAFEKIIRETGGARWLYLAKDIAYCHHERWDGSGYPNGLRGNEIPVYARIMAIADVYDAITSRRSYKDAYSHQEAKMIILEGKGSLFDPELVDIFEAASERFEEVLSKKQDSDTLEGDFLCHIQHYTESFDPTISMM